jgi:hypothetical protein
MSFRNTRAWRGVHIEESGRHNAIEVCAQSRWYAVLSFVFNRSSKVRLKLMGGLGIEKHGEVVASLPRTPTEHNMADRHV